MPASAAQVAALVRGDASLSARYAQVFGTPPAPTTRASRATSASRWPRTSRRCDAAHAVRRLARSPRRAHPTASSHRRPTRFPAAARRGLRLFVGRAGCSACHAGPTLGDDAFHVSLVHSMTAPGVPDPATAASPNAFRTPGLRDVAATAPYLHDGSAARLCDAVQPHAADPGTRAAAADRSDRRDLVAFLRTLSAPRQATTRRRPATIAS
jgi:hypothetical protein